MDQLILYVGEYNGHIGLGTTIICTLQFCFGFASSHSIHGWRSSLRGDGARVLFATTRCWNERSTPMFFRRTRIGIAPIPIP